MSNHKETDPLKNRAISLSLLRLGFPYLILLLLIGGIGLGGWAFLKKDFAHSEDYRLDPDRISVPERPPWVTESFVKDVLQAASLDRRETVLDSKLPEKLAAAFSANPWVAEVGKIQIRYPGQIQVELQYRSPVCMIETPEGKSCFPVDALGILLPTVYFIEHPEKTFDYILVRGIATHPIGSIGDRWGDPAVEGAARIASLLEKDAKRWEISEIFAIVKLPDESKPVYPREPMPEPRFRLIFKGGRQIPWGTVDIDPRTPEIPSSQDLAKKEKLRELLEQYGSPDLIPESVSLE